MHIVESWQKYGRCDSEMQPLTQIPPADLLARGQLTHTRRRFNDCHLTTRHRISIPTITTITIIVNNFLIFFFTMVAPPVLPLSTNGWYLRNPNYRLYVLDLSKIIPFCFFISFLSPFIFLNMSYYIIVFIFLILSWIKSLPEI